MSLGVIFEDEGVQMMLKRPACEDYALTPTILYYKDICWFLRIL